MTGTGDPTPTMTAEPTYTSWADFLAKTTESERWAWCAKKAKVANRPKLMSGRPRHRLTAADVLSVLEDSQGQCCYCGSLCVERRPSDLDTGAPLPWETIGRRIGSLEHREQVVDGGLNVVTNLAWCCLWCNTWPSERTPGAPDHGGTYPRAVHDTRK